MKFVHIADMHFDAPFSSLSERENLGDIRRLEQREVFKKIIEYIKENNIELFFIAGDLYEQEYIREATIQYINDLFKQIPNTTILIAPGNHDPYIKNSYYYNFNWNENVIIFDGKIQKIQKNSIDIYGYGFTDFYCSEFKIEDIKIENQEKVNILIVHGSLDSGSEEEKKYNPLSLAKLKESSFDYIALRTYS